MRSVVAAGRPRAIGGWSQPIAASPHPALGAFTEALPPRAAISLIPEAQDQGEFGRCAGETGREVMTGIALRDGIGERLYSANYPYWWARFLDGADTKQDTGTYVATIFQALAKVGNCLKATWDDDTSIYDKPTPAADQEAAQHRALLAFYLPNLLTLKGSIVSGFPIAFGFDVPKQMMSDACAASGLVEFPADDSGWDGGGHAVSGWGYDDELVIGSSVGAVLCLNHWSTSWGQNGRFWLPYRFFQTGHATDAHTLRLAEV